MSEFNETPEQARALWVSALRSGEYKQVTGTLHSIPNDAYCCLGVACETFSKLYPSRLRRTAFSPNAVVNYTTPADVGVSSQYDTLEDGKVVTSDMSILPVVVSKWLDVSPDGLLKDEHRRAKPNFSDDRETAESLVALNDSLKCSFEEIAHEIEADHIQRSYYAKYHRID